VWQLVTELNRRAAAYLHFGDRDAVLSDDLVALAQRVLHASGRSLPNGPVGLEQDGLNAVASIFLCRSHAVGCSHDHSAIMGVLRPGESKIPDQIAEDLLHHARVCLLWRSWQRLAALDAADLVSAECSWEMNLLARADAELVIAGQLDRTDMEAPYCIARQRWLRYLEMPAEEGALELRYALAGFERVYRPGATIVPPLVREYLECLGYQPPAGHDVKQETQALRLLAREMRVEARQAGREVLRARRGLARTGAAEAEIWLCTALVDRGLGISRLADVEEAISRGSRIWTRTQDEPSAQRGTTVSTLLRALLIRVLMTDNDDDLVMAQQIGLAVINNNPPPESWATWEIIRSLAAVCCEIAKRTREPQAIEMAIMLAKVVAIKTKDSHLDPAKREAADKDLYIESIFFLSLLYKERFDQFGNAEDLRQATQYGGQAEGRARYGGPEWTRYAFAVARIFFAAYQAGWSGIHLDNAITVVRKMLWTRPDPDAGTGMLSERRTLAGWLMARFRDSGHISDQEEAVKLFVSVAEEAGGDPEFPPSPTLWINASIAAASSATTEAQARRAVAWARKALELSAAGSDNALHAHFALCQALRQLHVYDDTETLDEAIDHAQRVLDAPAPDQLRAGAAYERARLLVLRNDLDDPATLAALEFAVGVAGDSEVRHHAGMLLASALLDRARRGTGDQAMRRRGIALLEEIALARDADGSLRVRAALFWAQEAVVGRQYSAAARAYRAAIDELPSPLWWASMITERRRRIRELDGVARAAAACAIQADMLEHAVESLERGRAMLWNQALLMRVATERVTAADPDLGQQFSEVLDAQEDITAAANPLSFWEYMRASLVILKLHNITGVHPHDAPRALANHWQDLVARARRIPGLADVMRPPDVPALRGAVAGGAAVFVNISDLRSHALLVTPDGIDAVELPGVTGEKAAAVVREFWPAIHMLDLGIFDRASRAEAKETMKRTRRWLWDAIAGPVLDRLQLPIPADDTAWPRVWWCPTGVLSMLPLHAAGDDESGDCVIDRVISSYTTTLSALIQARARTTAGSRSILAVGSREIPGTLVLPGVAEELADLDACFPGEVTHLDGAKATGASLVDQIRRHSWIHLACHGTQGFGEYPPALFLHDGPFRIERLGWSASHQADLAFLSACSTAEIAMDMADEAHHLAAAFQIAGFRHVVATQWGTNDRVAVGISRGFYDRLNQPGHAHADGAAEALHHVVRAVRADGHSAHVWAPYVHYGP
jgi:tetratricopeptide (TPR) repeat protein